RCDVLRWRHVVKPQNQPRSPAVRYDASEQWTEHSEMADHHVGGAERTVRSKRCRIADLMRSQFREVTAEREDVDLETGLAKSFRGVPRRHGNRVVTGNDRGENGNTRALRGEPFHAPIPRRLETGAYRACAP